MVDSLFVRSPTAAKVDKPVNVVTGSRIKHIRFANCLTQVLAESLQTLKPRKGIGCASNLGHRSN